MEKTDKKDWLRDHKLKVAGIAYVLGDTCLFISGFLSGRRKEALAGLLYTSGGAVSALFGNPGAQRQIQNIGGRLGDFMIKQGAKIPHDAPLYTIMQKRHGGMVGRVEDFLYRHPSETTNAIYAVGGMKLMHSGMGKPVGGMEDMAAGGLVTTGGIIGALAPENKNGNIITKKPLRIAGLLYMLNNVFLVKSGWKEYQNNPAQHSYVFKFLTAALFLTGNIFMAFSSRHHTENAKDSDTRLDTIASMAAGVIALQPDYIQGALTREVAGFLSLQPEFKQDAEKITGVLQEKIAAITPKIPEAQALTTAWQDKMLAAPSVMAPAFSSAVH